mgnify:CR=1 FL=1
MATNFTRTNASGIQRWQRTDKPEVFVTHYPALRGVRPGVFYVYRAVAAMPAGRKPWTVDNRRVSTMTGNLSDLRNLRAALTVAEAV